MKHLIGALAALVVLSSYSLALAEAACTQSCTQLKNGCIGRGGNAAACTAGYAECLKTGTYGGMPSGRTWTKVCKK